MRVKLWERNEPCKRNHELHLLTCFLSAKVSLTAAEEVEFNNGRLSVSTMLHGVTILL
jgi:hypothetical protein